MKRFMFVLMLVAVSAVLINANILTARSVTADYYDQGPNQDPQSIAGMNCVRNVNCYNGGTGGAFAYASISGFSNLTVSISTGADSKIDYPTLYTQHSSNVYAYYYGSDTNGWAYASITLD